MVAVPVLALRAADSPRLNGEDKAHIARLAETETPLPPILVNRRTMRVIDGMHRLMAASLQGRYGSRHLVLDLRLDARIRRVGVFAGHGAAAS